MSATNRGAERVENDHYPTEPWVIEAVLPMLETRLIENGAWPKPRIYEPACGVDLSIVKTIQKHWPHAIIDYSDIISMHGGVDFLEEPPEPVYDLIITNPPYTYAQEFQDRAKLWKRTQDSIVCLLLRLNFLESKKRAKWWRQNVPSLAITPKRPSFGVNKHGVRGTDSTAYSWYLWPGEFPYITFLETEDL